ncbi:MAG: phosphatase, partial [Bacteroidota bacterium]
MTKRIAALDLGTNLFHILIADISSQAEINPILKKDFMVQIGEGGMSAKQILPAAYQRGLTTMRDIHQLVTTYKVDTVLGCATSAIRDAENGKAFIKEVF